MKRIKRILALALAAAMLSLLLGAVAEQVVLAGAQEVEQAPAQEALPEVGGAEALAEEARSEAEAGLEAEPPADASREPAEKAGPAPIAGGDAAEPGFVMDGSALVVYDGGAADVIVPDGVTSIGPAAFCNLPELRSVAVPSSVERIGSYAFADCEGLEAVALGDGLRYIDDHAFEGCAKLQKLALPEGLLTIGDEAFDGCASLSDVALPASVAVVGEASFPEGALAEADGDGGEAEALAPISEELALGAGDVVLSEGNWPILMREIGFNEALTIGVRERLTLDVDFEPSHAGDALTFTSDNPEIVKVVDAARGEIQGAKAGIATVTAASEAGSVATCKVTVLAAPKKASFNPNKGSLGVGQRMTLKLVLPRDTASNAITWSSNRSEIATVEDGLVTARSEGKAKIRAKTFNGRIATYTLTVNPAAEAAHLPESVKLCLDQRYIPDVALEPEGAQSDIRFASSDESVVAVEGNALLARSLGGATITATARNGDREVETSCSVTVVLPPTGIRIANPVEALGVKESYTFVAALQGDAELGAHNLWSSDKPSVLKVLDASEGRFQAVKKGEATVKVTSANGLTDQLTVKVLSAPKKVSLSEKKRTLGVGDQLRLTAKPSKNAAAQIRWSSNKPEVATVEGGLVRALSEGTAKITATAYNGKKASCVVTVKPAPKGIDGLGSVALGVGQEYALTIGLSPANAAGDLVIENSNEAVLAVEKREIAAVGEARVKLTALSEGSATLRIETGNGKQASCEVTVCPAPTELEIENPVRSLGVGEEYRLRARSDSDAALLMHCTWKSSNKKVLQVDPATGRLTARKAGKAKITAMLPKGGSTIKQSLTISVAKAPDSVTVNPGSASLRAGETVRLAAVLPGKASSQISWMSEDEGVATVDAEGLVRAVGGGEARIVARAFNGVCGSCTVAVEGVRAPSLWVDGDAAKSTVREVFDDVELSWSSAERVERYDVLVTGEDGSELLRMDGAGEDRATLAKAQMRPGMIYTIRVRATMGADGGSVALDRVARVRYSDPTRDFRYEFDSDGAVITGYRGASSSVTVPGKLEGRRVVRIATGAFNGGNCALVTSISWPAGVAFEANSVAGLKGCADRDGFLVFDGVLCEYFGREKTVAIPEGVTRVNDGAFEGNASVVTVEIPSTVQFIGPRAFADCAKLKAMVSG